MIPDAEEVIGKYLRTHAAVKALGARVVPETPGDRSKPWAKVTQIDARAAGGSRTDHLIGWVGQLDCYAGAKGGQDEASLLTRTVREALRIAHLAEHDGAVITGVEFGSCPRIPDEDFEPVRERYALGVTVWMHP